MGREKITIPRLKKFLKEDRKITMLTAYDFTMAKLLEDAGVDIVLVGDSLGMVIQGKPNTLEVTLEEMIYHSRAVSRALHKSHLMVDMPFLSYQVSSEQALQNAGRLLKEGRAESVKMEGGLEISETIYRLSRAGIPVMAHIGLRPQNIHQMGGYFVQGRNEEAGKSLLKEAKAHEEAGVFSLLLEGIPASVARQISDQAQIPTIGIYAGSHCHGQVLVIYDLLGMDKDFSPRFVKRYASLHEIIGQSLHHYIEEVRAGKFPTEENSIP